MRRDEVRDEDRIVTRRPQSRKARNAAVVMRRTDFSESHAIALRSAPMSYAVASPQLTVTSIAPDAST